MGWSYTREIKAELAAIPTDNLPCLLEELRGIAGAPLMPSDLSELTVASALVARRAYRLLKALGGNPKISVVRRGRAMQFVLCARSPMTTVLGAKPCPQAFVRGAFLSRGYLSDRDRPAHLEIIAGSEEQANELVMMLTRMRIRSKAIARRGSFLIYLKGRDAISRFLTVVGAHHAVLDWESQRVMRSIKNNVNRIVNSETANLRRAVESGMVQAQELRQWERDGLIARLPDSLRIVAELRMQHPTWSLTEIGLAAIPPLSKSAVNHRLRRIREWIQKD